MPDWLIQTLREILPQFPMVAIVIGVFLLAEHRVRKKEMRLEDRWDQHQKSLAQREDRLRKEAREDRDVEIERFQKAQTATAKANDRLLAAKDEQIANLTTEVEKLRKELATLTKKLSG